MSKAKKKKAVVRRHDKVAASTLASHRNLASVGKKGVTKILEKMRSNPRLAQHVSSQPVGKLDRLLDGPSRKGTLYVPDRELKPWTCEHCGHQYKTKGEYRKHVNRHNGVKRHSCIQCGQSFFSTSNLYVHTKVHSRHYKHTSNSNLTCIFVVHFSIVMVRGSMDAKTALVN